MTNRASDAQGDDRPGLASVIVGGPNWVPPRFLAPWLADATAIDRLNWMSEATGLDLIHLGTVAAQGEINGPATSRPLATALAILTGERLLADVDPESIMIAGHGTGEIAAAVLAGVLEPADGLDLAVRAGRAEAATAERAAGGQVAVLGGYPQDIEDRVATLGLSIAAYNGGGDLVISGRRAGLDALLRDPPRHSRVEALPACGAFGSHMMSTAADEVRAALPGLAVKDSRFRLVSGMDGRVGIGGRWFLDGLVNQLTGRVRWDLILEVFATQNVRVILELPPAGALTGLAIRGAPGINAIPLNTPEILTQAAIQLAAPQT